MEGEVDGHQEEGQVGDGDAELEGSSVLEIEEGRHGTPGAARGEAGEVEAGGDAEHNEPAEHSESEGIFLDRILILFYNYFKLDLSDVLLVREGEHYGHVAVQDPHELREKVEIEGKVDQGQHQRALDSRLVDGPQPSEQQPEGGETEEAGQEDIGLVDVPRLVQFLVPDDHEEHAETQAGQLLGHSSRIMFS